MWWYDHHPMTSFIFWVSTFYGVDRSESSSLLFLFLLLLPRRSFNQPIVFFCFTKNAKRLLSFAISPRVMSRVVLSFRVTRRVSSRRVVFLVCCMLCLVLSYFVL